ncbi:MAG: tRNA pseudouridine(38-40) synthase TruA [Epsilonproteobacteria bacterium]|nr:tRNA pseudouridine(38-40) synthase TruA [Campylobacterota bacterium]
MRVALTVSYNGASFEGFQIQKHTKNTIAGALEHVLGILGIESKIVASGRTDAGVHATGQVCHIDLPPFWSDLTKLQRVMNEMLPKSIHVKRIREESSDFHARYSAKKRLYRYIIKVGEPNPFEDAFVTFVESLDFDALQEKIALFVGEHDFAYFMKSGSDIGSTVRTVYNAYAYRHRGYIVLHFEANGFLRTQIRLMVGALLKFTCQEITEQLTCQKKHRLKPAPGNGLYLAKIKY